MKNSILHYIAILLLILAHSQASLSQIKNGSFENWTIDTTQAPVSLGYTLDNWIHCDRFLTEKKELTIPLFGTYRDTVSHSGNFALTLSRWYNNDFDVIKYQDTISTRPTFVTGYYKYFPSELSFRDSDTAFICAYITKFNVATNMNDTLGIAKQELNPARKFTYFEIPVKYANINLIPDKITIFISPSKFQVGVGSCHNPPVDYCSYLSSVDINYTNIPLGTSENFNTSKQYNLFPNPMTSQLTIKGELTNKSVKLVDVFGKIIETIRPNENTIHIKTAHYCSGTYFVFIGNEVYKLIKQ
ncbi:MAG: T9SS type A sorting domain-containing protein [Saprospiraceae bacterium]|nr:T9SS type A sorting domain-containing protein [Saprospiraceae bacterium]